MTDKTKIRAEIERLICAIPDYNDGIRARRTEREEYKKLNNLLYFVNSLPEEPVSEDMLDVSRIDYRLQHKSIEDGIKYHAEEYSFNIESVLYNQLTGEQQKLWRKELERAVISGGYYGWELSRDNTWLAPEKKVSLCEHCKLFCASRSMIRKQRERKAFNKEVERDWNKNYCAAVRAGVAQEEGDVINLDLVL